MLKIQWFQNLAEPIILPVGIFDFFTRHKYFGKIQLRKILRYSGNHRFLPSNCNFLFTQVVLKGIHLWIESSNKESDLIGIFFDFQEIQKRIQSILNLLAVGLRGYRIIYYLLFFDPIYDEFLLFLKEEHKLRNTFFDFGAIFLLIGILIVSSFLANNIAST